MNKTEFKTTDIVLASTLIVHKYNLQTIEVAKQSDKGTFVFEQIPESFIDDFYIGNIKVEPIAFNNTIRRLTSSVRRKLER